MDEAKAHARHPEVCERCGEHRVQLVEALVDGDTHWIAEFYCPDCWYWCKLRLTNDEGTAYDEEYEAGCATIKAAADRLLTEIMEEEIAWFVPALRAGKIVPEDFGRPELQV